MTRYFVDSDAVLAATASAHSTIARVQADIQTLTSQLQALQSSWGWLCRHSVPRCVDAMEKHTCTGGSPISGTYRDAWPGRAAL